MFTVATHNGSFHADELTACVILSLLYEDIKIIRSRNLETLEQGDIVIDVSGQFDLEKHFDHHPKEFTKTRADNIKYATAGLIWEFYGRKLLKKYITDKFDNAIAFTDVVLEKAWTYIENNFMQYIDLSDNGQLDTYTKNLSNPNNSDEVAVYDKLNAFYMKVPTIPVLIALQNTPGGTEEEQYENFMRTLECFKTLFNGILINCLKNARDEEKVIASYKGGELLILSEKLPWFDTVYNNWELFKDCKLAIYPDHNKEAWRIQSLPASLSARFENRCSAPKSWHGKEGEELNALAGIKSATFVHKAGFTGGAKTFEDVQIMAQNWIKGE